MRLTVLGSGTLVPDDRRRSPAHLVEDDGVRLLLDCGAGTVHGFQRHGVDWAGVTHVALSHYHTDHVGDFAAFLFALKWGVRPPREAALTVLGPPGLLRFLDALAEAFGASVSDPGFPLEVVELPPHGSWEDPVGGLRLRTHPTRHTEASAAWRVEVRSGAVGYTGDTGPAAGLEAFFAGVDVLIAECSFPDPPPMDTHLTPRGVAEVARGADPGLVLLTHLYPMLDAAAAPALVRAAGFAGRVATAWDGTVVEADGGEARLVVPGPPAGATVRDAET
ncbi:MAG TPA: ribonuclease Z [Longimicrobiales bacterium]|nr:ribonuclease Z [Longimicrobiales bacterium]